MPEQYVETWYPENPFLTRRGRTSISISRPAPSELIKPSASNTGHITALNSLTVDGTTTSINSTPLNPIRQTLFTNRLTINAPNVIMQDSKLTGYYSGTGGNSSASIVIADPTLNFLIEDCTIRPSDTTICRTDGIRIVGFTMRRCDISGTVDGIGIYAAVMNGACNVLLEGNYVHGLAYAFPDPTGVHSDGTHNDSCQLQGGSNVTIRWNTLEALYDMSAGTHNATRPQANAAIQTGNSRGPLVDHHIYENWLTGGGYCVNIGGTTGAGFGNVDNNKFGRDMVIYDGNGPICIGGSNLVTSAVGNVFEDNGNPARIHWIN